jgi:DNA-binding LacI/PurR family transcriptional regulator
MRKTLKDVAEKAGVSVAVASRVLGNYGYVSEGTRIKVLKIAQEIGYQPDILARGLKTKKTYSIGVIISDITTFFFTSVVRGIEDVASQSGYNVTLCNSDEDPQKEKKYLEELYRRGVDGIILSATGKNLTFLKKLTRGGMPVVLVDRRLNEIDTIQIVVDNKWGAYEAMEHLIKLGYRRIGVINGLRGIMTSEERFSGYCQALEENGFKVDPELVKYGDFRMEKGKQAMLEFLEMKSPPEAIFVTNEVMTTGALLALREKKVRIPDDIAIVGFDDPVWAPLIEPPLTSVRQPSYSIGTIASQTLLQKIANRGRGRPAHEEIVLKPKLIIRESCGEKNKK